MNYHEQWIKALDIWHHFAWIIAEGELKTYHNGKEMRY
jgi:hypothetical protein